MEAYVAMSLINKISYKPGWTLYTEATPDGKDVLLTVNYKCQNSNSELAPFYDRGAVNNLYFDLKTEELATESQLHRVVLNALIECEKHEAEEFFKVGWNYEAPFHPHTEEGKVLLERTANVAVPSAH